MLCQTAEQARAELEFIRQWVTGAKLTLHPIKTRLADLSVAGGYVDFPGYRFTYRNGGIKRDNKPKKITALKAPIKKRTPRVSGESTQSLIATLNRFLRGAFEYFLRISHPPPGRLSDLQVLGARVRYRLRRIFGKRQGKLYSGRDKADRVWSNDYFVKLGLFSMQTALTKCHSSS